MKLDFTSDNYKELALAINKNEYDYSLTKEDAFLILLKDIDYKMIDNLCLIVSQKLSINDPKEIYEIIQSKECDSLFKETLLDTSYEIIDSRGILETNRDPDKNSSWICHSLLVGRLSGQLAEKLNLNSDIAIKLGILHDIGRKFTHSFLHTIKGFEYLYNLGLKKDAVCCLTHSFLSPNYNSETIKCIRCANCDLVLPGFYVDENGNGLFLREEDKDDMSLFLDNYEYNLYDMVLNISDLMATSTDILSPYDRLMDINTRKPLNITNSVFFKTCFINIMRKIIYLITTDNNYKKLFKYKEIENIDEELIKTSDDFYNMYKEYCCKKGVTRSL